MINRPAFQLQSVLSDDSAATEDSWMLSYIDVFVLMTTLFIVLIVLNKSVDSSSEGNFDAQQSHAATATTSPDTSHSTKGEVIEVILPSILDQASWVADIEKAISSNKLDELVALKKQSNATELDIASRVLFDSGEASLTRPGAAVLEKLTPLLKASGGLIYIEGHTDNQPIETARFPSNWVLASARATEVLAFFVSQGMDQSRFRAVSYADTKPVAPNDTQENRGKNRRVSIVIHQHHNAVGSS